MDDMAKRRAWAMICLHEHFTKPTAAECRQHGQSHEVGNSRVGGFKGGTADEGVVIVREEIGHAAFQVAADPRLPYNWKGVWGNYRA